MRPSAVTFKRWLLRAKFLWVFILLLTRIVANEFFFSHLSLLFKLFFSDEHDMDFDQFGVLIKVKFRYAVIPHSEYIFVGLVMCTYLVVSFMTLLLPISRKGEDKSYHCNFKFFFTIQ